ncbi:sugar phosphate isomerase/epimerase [Chloroflexi bacterium TSY]|nr:sugar phosphate isomerase/epimerase [Chloroflexi bacterium TSY]
MPTGTDPLHQYAICNELFEGWSLQDTAAFVAELGYQGLELAPFTLCELVTDLSSTDRLQIRQTVEGAGLSVVGLHWLLAKTEGFQLNDRDPVVRERTAQYMLDLIDCCADLGGEILIFGSPQQRDVPDDRSREDAWSTTVEIMHRCGERAQQQDVTFCVEPLSTAETNFITKVDEAAQLVHDVAHPGFQMMVDTKAMSHTPRPIAAQIRSVHPLFQHVHVNDPNLRGPGMGDLDFRPIFQMLNELNYSRWVSVEVFDFTPGAERTARESLDYLRRIE